MAVWQTNRTPLKAATMVSVFRLFGFRMFNPFQVQFQASHQFAEANFQTGWQSEQSARFLFNPDSMPRQHPDRADQARGQQGVVFFPEPPTGERVPAGRAGFPFAEPGRHDLACRWGCGRCLRAGSSSPIIRLTQRLTASSSSGFRRALNASVTSSCREASRRMPRSRPSEENAGR